MSKPSHRWGKLNHGQTYGLLADDVARRLSTISLGDYERLLLEVVRENSWARSTRRKTKDGRWPDAIPFRTTITAIARELAGDRLNNVEFTRLRAMLYRAEKSLADDAILLKDDGQLFINTNCDEWSTIHREFVPRRAGVLYALKAQSIRPTDGSNQQSSVAPGSATSCTPEYNLLHLEVQRVAPGSATSCTPECNDSASPPETPYMGTCASEDLRSKEEEEDKRQPPPKPPSGGPMGKALRDAFRSDRHASEFYEACSEPERAVYRLVIDSPGHGLDTGLAEQVVVQFRARVGSGITPADVHSSFLAASQERPGKPDKWSQWVSTNTGRRKVRGEVSERQIRDEAARSSSPLDLDPEEVERARLARIAKANENFRKAGIFS